MTDLAELRRLAGEAAKAMMPSVPAIDPQSMIELLDRLELTEKALERLGSMEAMTMSFYPDYNTNEGAELLARVKYAEMVTKQIQATRSRTNVSEPRLD